MLKIAKVVGLNSDTNAALTLVPSEVNLEDISPSPHLFILAYCRIEDAFSKTRLALAEAEDVFASASGSLVERLPQVLEYLQKNLSEAEELEVLVAVTYDTPETVLYLLYQGSLVKAYLIREGKRTDLCQLAAAGELISGVIKEGDRVVMVTQSLVELLGEQQDILNTLPVGGLEDEVMGRLPQAQDYPVAAVVIHKEVKNIPPLEERKDQEIEPLSDQPLKVPRKLPNILPTVGFFLGRLVPRSKRGMAIVGVMLLLIILSGTIFTYRQKQNSEVSASFNKSFQQAGESFNKAQSLKDLDRAGAAQSLVDARTALTQALKIKPQDNQALGLKKQIEDNAPTILKIFPVNDFPLWLDLDLAKKGFKASHLSLSLGKLLVLDTTQDILLEVNLETKASQLLAGQEKLGTAKMASLNGDIAWVFSEDKGILKVDTKNNAVVTAIKNDSEWGNIADFYGFGGNVYLLDETKNQIWKYLPTVAGYSDKREYFKGSVDLKGAKKMEIDSSVWILKSDGNLYKYTQGTADYFSLGGLDKPIKELQNFFVADQTDNVYLLDGGNNRLVVVDKKGAYVGQYQSDKLTSFSDFVVDETEKKAFFLSGSKIFQMELK